MTAARLSRRTSFRVLPLALALAFVAAGCSDSAAVDEPPTPSNGGRTSTAPPTSSQPDPSRGGDGSTESRADEALLAYARCMRDQGLDFPDPTPLPGGEMGFSSESLEHLAPALLDRAFAVCGDRLDPIQGEPPSPDEEARWLDAVVEYARCMREHGIRDLPDPRVDYDGGGIEPGAIAIQPWHKGDPAFERATRICDEIVAGWFPGGELAP
jgi:hypothetical protein